MNMIATTATPTGAPALIPAPRQKEPFRIMTGWIVSDITTTLAAENAIQIVLSQIVSIETQVAEAQEEAKATGRVNADWLRRAQCALKIKRAGLEELHAKLAELRGLDEIKIAPGSFKVEQAVPVADLLLAEIDLLDGQIIEDAKNRLRARGVAI